MFAINVSIMVLPTKKIRSSPTPDRRRFLFAVSLVVKNQSVMASVTIRLISSGIDQSPERIPPSTWATRIHSLRAAIAHAIVEVTSPTTRQKSLRSLKSRAS